MPPGSAVLAARQASIRRIEFNVHMAQQSPARGLDKSNSASRWSTPYDDDELSDVDERDEANDAAGSTPRPLQRQDTQTRVRTALRRQKHRCLIDPRRARFLPYWDVVTTLALAFTILVTPAEVAFSDDHQELDVLWWMNRVVDAIFVGDMLLQFVVMYPEGTDHQLGDGLHWVSDRRKIAMHYLTSWFVIDLFSIAPVTFDVLPLISPSTSALNDYFMLRAARILRLIKLVRLARTSRILKRWQSQLPLDYGTLALLGCLLLTLLAAHWFACIIGFIATIRPSMAGTWMFAHGYCEEPAQDASWTASMGGHNSTRGSEAISNDDIVCVGPVEMYIACVYWGVLVITGSGGTDFQRGMFSPGEQICVTFLVLVGGYLWTYVLAVFCEVIANSRPDLSTFRRNMGDLNRMMRMHRLPRGLRHKCREYFHQSKHLHIARASEHVIDMMSPLPRLTHTHAAHRTRPLRVVRSSHCGV